MIETERLLLRKPRLEDDLAEFVADAEVQHWIGGPQAPEDLITLWVRRWERNDIGQFVVELDGEIIGRVGFIVWDASTWKTSAYDLAGEHAETELGWAILSRHWGHGYAVEASRAARAWARSVPRVISLIDPKNARSIRVAEKLGATRSERVQTDHALADVWVHPR